MAQQATSSPWARPFSTSRTPASKPGSSGISLFTPWRLLGYRTAPSGPASWHTSPISPRSHDRLRPGSEHAKATSRPGLAAVEEGVQGPREERVLIWSVSGNHHAHVSAITALGLVTPEGEPDAQR